MLGNIVSRGATNFSIAIILVNEILSLHRRVKLLACTFSRSLSWHIMQSTRFSPLPPNAAVDFDDVEAHAHFMNEKNSNLCNRRRFFRRRSKHERNLKCWFLCYPPPALLHDTNRKRFQFRLLNRGPDLSTRKLFQQKITWLSKYLSFRFPLADASNFVRRWWFFLSPELIITFWSLLLRRFRN